MSDDIKLPKGNKIALNSIDVVELYTADQLRAVVRTDREGRQPIPVAEHKPSIPEISGSVRVLAWWPANEEGYIAEGWSTSFYQTGNCWQHACGSNDYHLGVKPTHWMPMPPPPCDAQRAKEPT